MSFDIDVWRRVGGRELGAAFASGPGVTALVGPSGAGKTSVLDMVAGLARPERGHVVVAGMQLFGGGVDVPAERRRVGYVFQDRRLFPHLTVRANLLYGAPGEARLGEVSDMLELGPLLARWPRRLSGGEAQRVVIGRALLSEPAFLLLDEPLAHLDCARAEEVMRAVERAVAATGLPTLYVTHRPDEVERLRARVVAVG